MKARVTTIIAMMIICCTAAMAQVNKITKEVSIGQFTKVVVTGPMTVNIREGNSETATVCGKEQEINELKMKVKDNTLYIGQKRRINFRRYTLSIEVQTNKLSDATLTGSGDINVFTPMRSAQVNVTLTGSGDIRINKMEGDKASFTLRGSGDISLYKLDNKQTDIMLTGSGDFKGKNISTKSANVILTGSGDIYTDGSAKTAVYRLQGSGDIHADRLKAESGKAVLTGSGSIRCNMSKELIVSKRGSGAIRFSGNPTVRKE